MNFIEFKEHVENDSFNDQHKGVFFDYELLKDKIKRVFYRKVLYLEKLESYAKDYPNYELKVRFERRVVYLSSGTESEDNFNFYLRQAMYEDFFIEGDICRDSHYKDWFAILSPVISLVTHYDTITISNGKNTHVIKDIFPMLETHLHDGNFRFNFRAMRMSFSRLETANSYVHSHLGTGVDKNKIVVKDFCLGSSEMKIALVLLNANAENNMNFKDELFLVISHIKPFIEWESKAGVPYITIDRINQNTKVTAHYAFIMEAIELMKNDFFLFNFYYDYFKKIYRIKFDDVFKQVVIDRRLDIVKSRLNQRSYNEIYGSMHEGNFISGKDGNVDEPELLFREMNYAFNKFTFKGKTFYKKWYEVKGKLDLNNLTYNKKLENYVEKISEGYQKSFKVAHQEKSRKARTQETVTIH